MQDLKKKCFTPNQPIYYKANFSTVEDLKIDINVIKLCKGSSYLFQMEHQFVKTDDCHCYYSLQC